MAQEAKLHIGVGRAAVAQREPGTFEFGGVHLVVLCTTALAILVTA